MSIDSSLKIGDYVYGTLKNGRTSYYKLIGINNVRTFMDLRSLDNVSPKEFASIVVLDVSSRL